MKKYPLPPFSRETAQQKVQMAEDAWNSKDPKKIALAYSTDTEWRNRNQFINGREEVQLFLSNKWKTELDYTLKKELWAFQDNRIAVRFEYEYRNKKTNGFGHMAMKIGNLMRTALCKNVMRVSTI